MLEALASYPEAQALLSQQLTQNLLAHAYVFIGAAALRSAEVFAQAVVGEMGAADIHRFEPLGVARYTIDQLQEMLNVASLAPQSAPQKVLIVERADALGTHVSNALLKSLEEPPARTVWILCAQRIDQLLPTVVSRCQQVVLKLVYDVHDSARVAEALSLAPEMVEALRDMCPSFEELQAFVADSDRMERRRQTLEAFIALPRMDTWEIIECARTLSAPFEAASLDHEDGALSEEEREVQRQRTEIEEEFLDRRALKALKEQRERAAKAHARQGITVCLSVLESALHDMLAAQAGAALKQPELIAAGFSGLRFAATQLPRAFEALITARSMIAHNVSPQLTCEVTLFAIKEALTCPPSYR